MSRIAIVGAGPSGFYAAEAALRSLPDVQVDIIDRLPTPYGLVRSGVAPDHAKTKQISLLFDRISNDARVRLRGNIELDRDTSVSELLTQYNAVVLAAGASEPKRLGIPGENLRNSHSSASFVGWYNGHPSHTKTDVRLDVDTAVIIGNGNVALDVCRILAKPVDVLSKTDIGAEALEAVKTRRLRRIVLMGRRSASAVRFTGPELSELARIPGWEPCISSDVDVDGAPVALRKSLASYQREAPSDPSAGRIDLVFDARPTSIAGEASVSAVAWDHQGKPVDNISAGLVVSCVGYRAKAIEGTALDPASGTIRNEKGRVVDESGATARGLYVVGWAKRGASGTIGTNRDCSAETVRLLVEDWQALVTAGPRAEARMHSHETSLADWRAIDAFERQCGRKEGRPRIKLTSLERMMAIAKANPPQHESSIPLESLQSK